MKNKSQTGRYVFLTVTAPITVAEGWEEIEDFAATTYLGCDNTVLQNGIPTHDTIDTPRPRNQVTGEKKPDCILLART